jgi:hypothetical protein
MSTVSITQLITEALEQSPTLSLPHAALLEIVQRAHDQQRISFPVYTVANDVLDHALSELMASKTINYAIIRPNGVQYQLRPVADAVYCERAYDGNGWRWVCDASNAAGESCVTAASAYFFTKREARRWANTIAADNGLSQVSDGTAIEFARVK